jgi:hypothetical protein
MAGSRFLGLGLWVRRLRRVGSRGPDPGSPVKGIVRLADHIERFENEGWIKVDRKVRNTWSVVLTPKGRVVVDQQRRQDR